MCLYLVIILCWHISAYQTTSCIPYLVYNSRPHAYGSHLETHSAVFTEAVQWISYNVNFFLPEKAWTQVLVTTSVSGDWYFKWPVIVNMNDLYMSTLQYLVGCEKNYGFGLWFRFLGLIGQNFTSAVVILDGIPKAEPLESSSNFLYYQSKFTK